MHFVTLAGRMGNLTALALALVGIESAAAQSMNYGSLEALFGEPVTTSATGSPQKASEAPVAMDIITAADIGRSGARNIAEVIGRVAGVNVIQGAAQDYSVAIRGYNEPLTGRLLVLVNGRQVYLDFFGFTDWAALPVRLEEIRQIEVVKGPNTALFGFNAAAGVVNIVTYNPAYDNIGAATLRGGSTGSKQASASLSTRIGADAGIRLSGGYEQAREYETQPNQLVQSRVAKLPRTQPSLFTLAAEGDYALAEGTQVTSEATTSFHDYNLFVSSNYAVQQASVRTGSFRNEIISDTPMGLLTGQIYENITKADTQSALPIDANLTVIQAQDLLRADVATIMRLSAEWRTNSMKSTPIQTGTVGYDVFSGSVMADHHLTAGLTVTAALRYDMLQLRRTGTFAPGIPQQNSQWDRSLAEISYNVGVVDQLTAQHAVRLTAARGLQLPSLFNLSVQANPAPAPAPVFTGAVALGNPSLSATVVTNYELGWDWMITDTAKLRTGAYDQINQNITAISNFNVIPPDYVIARAPYPSLLVASAEPFGKSDVKGIESAFSQKLANGWNYGVNGTYLAVQDDLNKSLLRRIAYNKTTPRWEANLTLGWTQGPWAIDTYLNAVAKTSSFQSALVSNQSGRTSIVLVPIAASETVDLRISYQLREGITLAFEGHNLSDDGALRTNGYRIPTEAIASLRFDF